MPNILNEVIDRLAALEGRIGPHRRALDVARLDSRVLTFSEWCALNTIGLRTGRRILRSGNGPAVVQLSARRRGHDRR